MTFVHIAPGHFTVALAPGDIPRDIDPDTTPCAARLKTCMAHYEIEEVLYDTETDFGTLATPNIRLSWDRTGMDAALQGSPDSPYWDAATRLKGCIPSIETLCRNIDSPTGAPIGVLYLGITFGEGTVNVLIGRGTWDLLVVSSWDPEPHLSAISKPVEGVLVEWSRALIGHLEAADTADLGQISLFAENEIVQDHRNPYADVVISPDDPRYDALEVARNAFKDLQALVDSLEQRPLPLSAPTDKETA